MIFQKSVLKNKTNALDFVGYTLVVTIFSAYLTYGICAIYGLSGSEGKVTALDVINGLAAIATASAFVLALLQYRKNIIQQRQQIVAAEAKALIEKMVEAASKIKTGSDTSLKNLDKSLTDLANIAVGFSEIYRSLNEDVERAIVRMRWQDMYYGHLVPALQKLDLIELLSNESEIDKAKLEAAKIGSVANARHSNVLPLYEKFFVYEEVLKGAQFADYDLKGKLPSLDSFVIYYINKFHTNDLMYGILNQIDIRVHAPLLAAAKPSDFAFADLQEKNKAP
ncbi:hypothetical protein ACIP61_14070 [Pseudomonas fulva]|uniref:hypothetical protein n=1 Tax=Pseudomonas TaxID=286 RepID=UPI0011A38625|nr:hypothetical protein [Pseudomonas sp. URMO17WK12:I11]MBH3363734.1 hypothetical protein [Pseudomonas sp. URMO17WK12:I11]